ncbi:MAG: polysaccharide biosynthesis tyrosine autokinase, partial [Myxococcota bacterium]|nr:polysaccharide biosynthesis tyrosine autokinase [Myxococcota bacterium]
MSPDPQAQPGPLREPSEDDGLPLAEYLAILLDEWRLFLVPVVLSMLIALGYVLAATPTFQASGVIQVGEEGSGGASALLELMDAGKPSALDTELEILRSRFIVARTLDKLGMLVQTDSPPLTMDFGVTLHGRSPLQRGLVELRRSIVEVAQEPWYLGSSPLLFSPAANGMRVQTKDGRVEVLRPGGTYKGQGFAFTLASGSLPRLPCSIEAFIAPRHEVIDDVLNLLRVEPVGGGRRDTSLLRVSFTHPDKTVAANFVNTLMESFEEVALDWRTMSADRTAAFIEQQLEKLRIGLEASERELQAFIETNGAVMLPEQATELIRSSSELDVESRRLEVQEQLLSKVTASLSRAEKRGEQLALTGDFVAEDGLLSLAVSTLNKLELDRATLLAHVTESHPQVARVEEEIRRTRGQIEEYVRSSRQRIADHRRALSRSLRDVQVQLSAYPDKERQIVSLRRSLEVSETLYKYLMSKLEEAHIVKASTTTNKRIIDRAYLPTERFAPKRRTTFMLAVILGLLLGAGLIVARRTLDPRIRDEEEAKNIAGIPLYGAVPDIQVIQGNKADTGSLDTIWSAPKGPVAESFRTLRTNIEFAQVGGEPLKVIQVTSSEAGEGKSTVIANLATALAKAGEKVLLVDLDLRRPSQHRAWGLPRSPGISDHLVGRAALPILHVERHGVDVITAGHEPPETQRMLASERLGQLVKGWRESYDYVLLDTPPLIVADSLVISKLSDL